MQIEDRVTIRDVARLAGVSKSTVSLVLNGGGGVAGPTSARVQATIARTGYCRDPRAQRFRQRRPGPVGVVLADPQERQAAALMAGLSERLREEGQVMLVTVSAECARAAAELRGEGASALVTLGPGGAHAVIEGPAVLAEAPSASKTVARIDTSQALRLAARSVRAAVARRLCVCGLFQLRGGEMPSEAAGMEVHWPDADARPGPGDGVLCPPGMALPFLRVLGEGRVVSLGGTETAPGVARIVWDGHAFGRAVGDAVLGHVAAQPGRSPTIVAPVWLARTGQARRA